MNGTGAKSLKHAMAIALVAAMTTGCASNGNKLKQCREYETSVKIQIDGKEQEKTLRGTACPDEEDESIWWASEDLGTLKQLLNWVSKLL